MRGHGCEEDLWLFFKTERDEKKSLGNTCLAVSLRPVTTVLGLNQGQFGWELQSSKCYWDRFFSYTSATSLSTISPILRTPHSLLHAFIHQQCGVCLFVISRQSRQIAIKLHENQWSP